MVALIKKDMYVVFKQIGAVFLISLLVALLPGMELFGNSYLSVMTVMLPMYTIAADEKCQWDKYAAMLPYRPKQIVLAKYIFGWMMIAIMILVSFLLLFIRTALGGTQANWREQVAYWSIMLGIMSLVFAIELPALFRFGAEKGRFVVIFLMFGIAAAIVGGSAVLGDNAETVMFGWLERLEPWMMVLGLLGAAAAAMAVSIPLAVRFYVKRRG